MTNNNKKPKNLLNQATNQILSEQENIKNLLLKKKESENEQIKSLLKQINQLKEESQLKKQNKTISIYFCDVCQADKNSKIDGEVYLIKIGIYPNKISSVCPSCRPNVVMLSDDDWKDF